MISRIILLWHDLVIICRQFFKPSNALKNYQHLGQATDTTYVTENFDIDAIEFGWNHVPINSPIINAWETQSVCYSTYRDAVCIGKFWTPGSANQLMIDTMREDEASGLWLSHKPLYRVEEEKVEESKTDTAGKIGMQETPLPEDGTEPGMDGGTGKGS